MDITNLLTILIALCSLILMLGFQFQKNYRKDQEKQAKTRQSLYKVTTQLQTNFAQLQVDVKHLSEDIRELKGRKQ